MFGRPGSAPPGFMWFHRQPSSPAPLPAAAAASYGHYRILEREDGSPWLLGHGTMGLTYKAEDINLRTPVALKVINPLIIERPEAREYFLAEARGAASLHHRNAAAVHHLGINRAGEFFFAMEFVEGETVETLVRRQGRLDVLLALDIAQQVACALTAAGRQRLIHRDIKPANLMLSDEGDGVLVVKVIDFGLCKALPPVPPVDKPVAGGCEPGLLLGTPHYASPEQIRNDPLIDGRSDFYSLGATLWTMLAGQPVFSGPLTQIRRRHLEEAPPIDDLPPGVSPPVRALLGRLLDKDPAGRPATPLELIDQIEGAAYDHRGAAADPRRHWQTQGCLPLLGTVLAHNFHLEALVTEGAGPGGEGPVFRAEDVAGQQRVLVRLLDRSKGVEDRREAVERASRRPHPNLAEPRLLASCRGQPFLVSPWYHGFLLEEVWHARGRTLPPAEVLDLVRQAALAVDHASDHELGQLNLRLDSVWVHFLEADSPAPIPRGRLTQPITQWPPYLLKLPIRIEAAEAVEPGWQDVAALERFASLLQGQELSSGPAASYARGADFAEAFARRLPS